MARDGVGVELTGRGELVITGCILVRIWKNILEQGSLFIKLLHNFGLFHNMFIGYLLKGFF